PADRALRFAREQQRVDDVVEVDQWQRLRAFADRDPAPGETDHRIRRDLLCAGPENLARAQHDGSEAAIAHCGAHLEFGRELGTRVSATQVRFRFVAGCLGQARGRIASGMVEHAHRADVDQAPRRVAQAGFDDVARAVDRAGLEIARAAAHRRADVGDDPGALHRLADRAWIAEVADQHLHAVVAGVGRERPAQQHAHALAARTQRLDQRATEEPAGAGYQGIHRREVRVTPVDLFAPQAVRFGARGFE